MAALPRPFDLGAVVIRFQVLHRGSTKGASPYFHSFVVAEISSCGCDGTRRSLFPRTVDDRPCRLEIVASPALADPQVQGKREEAIMFENRALPLLEGTSCRRQTAGCVRRTRANDEDVHQTFMILLAVSHPGGFSIGNICGLLGRAVYAHARSAWFPGDFCRPDFKYRFVRHEHLTA